MSDELSYEVLNNYSKNCDVSFKIVIIGDSGVGKTSLSIKGVRNEYEDYYTPTIGFEFFSLFIRINNIVIKLYIWDTCGQEVYKSLTTNFFRNSSLAIIMYAINDRKSYINVESWLNEIKTASNPDEKLFLIGNKCDLEELRQVKTEEAHKFSVENGFDYFIETSAKTGFNAQEIFIHAAKELYKENLSERMNISKNSILTSETDEESIYRRKNNNCCK